jgi:hypothetical protein
MRARHSVLGVALGLAGVTAVAAGAQVERVRNDKVLVVEERLAPGEAESLTGDFPSVVVYLDGGSIELTPAGGKSQTETVKRGEAVFQLPQAGTLRNVGASQLRIVRITYLGRGGGETWGTAGLAPHYSLLFENQYGRVYDIRIAAGTSEPLHSHHDRVVVCLSGAKLMHEMPDGRREPSTLETGDVAWRRGGTHIGHNVGQTDLWVIAIEPKGGDGSHAVSPQAEPPQAWRLIAEGLEVGDFAAPVPSDVGDSRIVAVRVDPARYEFRLRSAKLLGLDQNLTAREWVDRYGLAGVINASMYRADHKTSVAYMRSGERVNNPAWTKDNAVFAADPSDLALPPVQIIDRTCQDLGALRNRYQIVVQNIRMLDCAGRTTWARQAQKWSTACVGTDADGRVLLIHARSPYTTHDLTEILRALPLGLKRLMYVEGGPEASLYVRMDGREIVSRVGSFETGFLERDDNLDFWPIPNVLGFTPRTEAR